MFPTTLHKNIVQLDRQISLLENECKNMEVDKKKKTSKLEQSLSKCSKISNPLLKSPRGKASLKKSGYECPKRVKKLTPPISTRVHSTSSLQSSKPWSEICESLLGRKERVCGLSTNLHACSCQIIDNSNLQSDSGIENRCVKCICCKERPVSDLSQKNFSEKYDEHKKDHVLHKEVLFSNPDGTIEVTVIKKPNHGKENSIKKYLSLGDTVEKDLDSCKCQTKGQKWSEILGLDSSKKRGESCESSAAPDETHIIYQSQNHNVKTGHNREVLAENCKNKYRAANTGIFEAPVKLSRVKKPTEVNVSFPEKQTQCYPETMESKAPVMQIHDPIKLFQILVNELKQKPSDEKKKLLDDMESSINKCSFKTLHDRTKDMPEPKPSSLELFIEKNDFTSAFKQQYENLLKENELLKEELASKDNTIATMKKREDEYLSLISSLKTSLEKTKENAQDGIIALKELNNLRNKLLEEIKVTDALKKNHTKMQTLLEKYILENDKLKTTIKIYKLESEKHGVLLAGKEAEINRYKEEIKNFQRQISDHLETLKSNAQGIDVEKMMEAIIQQSHLFVHTDLDSVILEADQRTPSKQQNVLMHSSPTSTKTSVVNSSWKQISSIRDHDQSKPESEIMLELNDSDEKDYFQIFGGNTSSESESSKKSKETLIERLTEKKNAEFASCVSIQDHNSEGDFSTTKHEIPKDKFVKEPKQIKEVAQKVQSNIDELLENMKLKWSKEVYGTSQGYGTIEDFLSNSQISGISLNSEKMPSMDTTK